MIDGFADGGGGCLDLASGDLADGILERLACGEAFGAGHGDAGSKNPIAVAWRMGFGRRMKAPKTTEEKILAAIADLASRQSRLEIAMNEMIVAHMEIAGDLQRLTSALLDDDDDEGPLLDAEPVDPPSDLALDKWMAEQRKKDG